MQPRVPPATTYGDLLFKIIFCLLVLKLLFFTYLVNLGEESFIPAFGALVMTLAIPLFIENRKWNFSYLLVADIGYSTLFLVHSVYYAYFNDFASLYDINQANQLLTPQITRVVISLVGNRVLFFIDIILMPLILRMTLNYYMINKRYKRIAASVLMSSGIALNINSYTTNAHTGNNYFASIYFRYDFVRYLGIVNYQLSDVFDFLKSKISKITINQDDIATVKNWQEQRKIVSARDSHHGIAKGANLILIQVESLQNFVVNRTYKGREITPNLNRLAKRGLYFDNIYDQVADANSADATFLVNCSLYPARHGAVSFLYADNHFDSLPKLLRNNGYETAVMLAYKKNFWNYAKFDNALGFDRQFYRKDYVIDEKLGWALSDRSFFKQSIIKLKKLPRPFYALLRTVTSHAPFTAVDEKIDGFPVRDLEGEEIGRYLRSIHYVDAALGEFLRLLAQNELLSNSVIVIFGDHRARLSIGDLEKVGVADRAEDGKIPIIMSCPGRTTGSTHQKIGGLIDLAPTICALLGIDCRNCFFIGNDLMKSKNGYVIFRNGTIISGNAKVDSNFAYQQLKLSDAIIEKDLLRIVGNRSK